MDPTTTSGRKSQQQGQIYISHDPIRPSDHADFIEDSTRVAWI